jgi:hypothetical protein
MRLVATFITDDNATPESSIITGIRRPQINKNGVMIQSAEVVVTIGPN